MLSTLVAAAALLAAPALAQSPGKAIVVNKCNYNVFLFNTPSAGGGFSAIDQTLSPGGQYSQTFTQLSNGNGWSIKLSKSMELTNIMQYEYTWQGQPTIWYDLSDVNGNPWDGCWEITATPGCTPRQAAYRFSTDDAYGMQSCPSNSDITVTLCSCNSGGSGGASGSPSEASTPTVSVPTSIPQQSWAANDKAADPSPAAKVSKAAPADDGITVTNIKTVVTTAFVTATARPGHQHKRAEHVAQHAHHHHF